jgi:hypothetical protein
MRINKVGIKAISKVIPTVQPMFQPKCFSTLFIKTIPVLVIYYCMNKSIDWAGMKFGRLTILSPTDERASDGRILWKATCECGKECLVIPREAKNGHTVSCGCFRLEVSQSKAFTLHKKTRQYDPWISSARAVYKTYYTECDFDIFLSLTQKPCYYCGRQPFRTYNVGTSYGGSDYQMTEGNFTYNGLDRVDINKGHTSDNVVSCCLECNQAKNKSSLQEFLLHIERMYEYTREIRSHLLT